MALLAMLLWTFCCVCFLASVHVEGMRPESGLFRLPDYYKILEVQRNAAKEDIKKQYMKLALKLHPDKASADDPEKGANTERFKELSQAWAVLQDEEKRAKYDKQLENPYEEYEDPDEKYDAGYHQGRYQNSYNPSQDHKNSYYDTHYNDYKAPSPPPRRSNPPAPPPPPPPPPPPRRDTTEHWRKYCTDRGAALFGDKCKCEEDAVCHKSLNAPLETSMGCDSTHAVLFSWGCKDCKCWERPEKKCQDGSLTKWCGVNSACGEVPTEFGPKNRCVCNQGFVKKDSPKLEHAFNEDIFTCREVDDKNDKCCKPNIEAPWAKDVAVWFPKSQLTEANWVVTTKLKCPKKHMGYDWSHADFPKDKKKGLSSKDQEEIYCRSYDYY
eukprot:gb/GFBE01065893.1/.p1 GENE.gb/GFBE01065893.1/~~gb/GFBE01065893.1/.p1  ORF type:complete len:383 (+),score=63.12 gb/GFBE01065893.1/:1-1149(+)